MLWCTWGLGSEHRHSQEDGPRGLALLSLMVVLPQRKSWGKEGRWTSPRLPTMCCYSTPPVVPAMAQLLFISVCGTWAPSTVNELLVRFLLLTAWLPHHSLLSWNFGLVSWLAASACVQLRDLWAQDHVNQRAQSSFRWAAEVKHQQTLGEEKIPECIRALLAFYILVNILQSFFAKELQRTVSVTCFDLVLTLPKSKFTVLCQF